MIGHAGVVDILTDIHATEHECGRYLGRAQDWLTKLKELRDSVIAFHGAMHENLLGAAGCSLKPTPSESRLSVLSQRCLVLLEP